MLQLEIDGAWEPEDFIEILHRYQYSRKLNAEDDKVILNFLMTLKTLIERAPK